MTDIHEEKEENISCENAENTENATVSDENELTEDKEDSAQDSEEAADKKSFLGKKKNNAEIKKLNAQIEEQAAQLAEMKDRYARIAAEYDNFKKRTTRELDGRYTDAKCDVLKSILPVLDNFERALAAMSEDDSAREGVSMILEQFKGILASNGVSEIEALGAEFDPQYHNAVMHIEDENLGENVVAEVFEKGYKMTDRVLRYSMVKVAN